MNIQEMAKIEIVFFEKHDLFIVLNISLTSEKRRKKKKKKKDILSINPEGVKNVV